MKILKKALISEKSFQEAALSKFTFIVDKKASKESVAASCKELFGVDVLSVNIINTIGKVKRTKKGEGKRSDQKKAIITCKKGQKIDLFEEVEETAKNKIDKSKIEKVSDVEVKVKTKEK